MASYVTVIYDACVLYPAPLRDLLVRLAITGLVRARWTDQIHEAWIRTVLITPQEFIAALQRNQLTNTALHLEDSVDLI